MTVLHGKRHLSLHALEHLYFCWVHLFSGQLFPMWVHNVYKSLNESSLGKDSLTVSSHFKTKWGVDITFSTTSSTYKDPSKCSRGFTTQPTTQTKSYAFAFIFKRPSLSWISVYAMISPSGLPLNSPAKNLSLTVDMTLNLLLLGI